MSAAVAEVFEPAEAFYAKHLKPPSPSTSTTAANGTSTQAASPPAIQFLDHDDLFAEDPRNENLVIPELGIGAGPPIGIFGQGYVGKTIMSMSMGMAVALGRPLWGRHPVRQGIWLHFDYEQGRRESKKRVQRLAVGFGVGKEDLRGRVRVAIYPSVNLTTHDALKHYVEAMTGAACATVDALKGITPGVEENSSAMRDYMRVLSQASEETGCAIILLHHAGKTDPTRSRKEMGRGSSAIYDECQSVFVVTGEKGEDKRVTHEKDRELGEAVAEFGLRIEDVPLPDGDGGLSFESQVESGLRVSIVRGVAFQQQDRVVEFLRSAGGSFEGSKTALVEAIGMNRSEFFRALGALTESGRILVQSRSAKENRPDGRISLIADATDESSHRPAPSPTVGDGSDRVPEIVPPNPSFKDGRDDGTILEGDGRWLLGEV